MRHPSLPAAAAPPPGPELEPAEPAPPRQPAPAAHDIPIADADADRFRVLDAVYGDPPASNLTDVASDKGALV